jgi:hypothetical protein
MPDLTPEALAPLLWAAMCEDAETRYPGDPDSPRWDKLGTWGEDGEVARSGMLAVARKAMDQLAPAHAALTAERDMARADLADAHARQNDRWPRCPDGCGCRMDGEDSDARDCGCDGPCIMECRENGYPDAPSYRDLAVKQVTDEMATMRDERDMARAEMRGVAAAINATGITGEGSAEAHWAPLLIQVLAKERDRYRAALERDRAQADAVKDRLLDGPVSVPQILDALDAIGAGGLEGGHG